MKIQILVRSVDWLNSAGTRIRYARLKRQLKALGWHLAIDPIAAINDGLRLNADVYLFSKCQDSGAMMLAEMLREAGALVGFDLFDDYFSNSTSLAFGHRAFQRTMVNRVDFLLCSTKRMAEIASDFDPQVPVHVLNDPHDPISSASVAQSLRIRLEETQASRTIKLVWFGHGNNPIFPVGLNDAVAFGSELSALQQAGWLVQLHVLSNREALDEAIAGPLQTIPAEVTVEEWSEAGEAAALDRALVAFVPVNFQNFSTAKSLNRAVSALARGAQVLSPGYPLYDPLAPFIYKSVQELGDHLTSRELRLNEQSVQELASRLAAIADPKHEAEQLIRFLNRLKGCAARPVEERLMRGIIHGSASPPAIHRLCKSLGWLSLGSPFSRLHQPFHGEIAQFEPGKALELRVSREGFARLGNNWRESAQPLARSADGYSHLVPLPDNAAGRVLAGASSIMWESRAARIVTFPTLMHATCEVYAEIFPQTRFIFSEQEMPLAAPEPFLEGGK
ncbi:hypothetical protein [Novosphingobium ginsenosidimutans]|uniref:Glycosyltransferase family 4 protein n=1 Tax=Novosphingobium ginsenosidimutans TaxID=1176536 RepID=A0A5B8S3U9_9SPHN|nr:hypothetical protein [Novosphingobium ginsenosidimutans]QEA15818.1 hypothetical protein FRF71_06500 [Novosphingobium ginsenosidimutans]